MGISSSSPLSSSSSGSSGSSGLSSSFGTSRRTSQSLSGYAKFTKLNKPSWYDTIERKLRKDDILKNLGIETEEQLDELIMSLGEKDVFLEKYLKLDPKYIDHHIKEIYKENRQWNVQECKNIRNNLLEKRRHSNVYFFITKLSDGISDSSFKRKIAKHYATYGAFHVGIEIDGIMIEWGTGAAGQSLIYPRIDMQKMMAHFRISYESNTSNTRIKNIMSAVKSFNLKEIGKEMVSMIHDIFVSDVSEVKIGSISSNKLSIIAEQCVNWNRNYDYYYRNRNCQTFITELLKALNIEFEPQGEFQKFLDRVIKDADNQFKFKNVEFKSRKELDNYADQHWDSIEETWDKKLLLCYSDVMQNMYVQNNTSIWGPMNCSKWDMRGLELRS